MEEDRWRISNEQLENPRTRFESFEKLQGVRHQATPTK